MKTTFKTKLIDNTVYISHTEIANWVFDKSVALYGSPNKAYVLRDINSEVKQCLLTLHAVPTKCPVVVRQDFEVYADRSAFYSLVQFFNWPDDIFTPVLVALGEFGDDVATQLQAEMQADQEAVA